MTLANGTRCEGEFQNDWLSSFAVCSFASGMRYEGEFRNGRQGGKGVYILTNGARLEGTWKNGKFVETKNKLNSIQRPSPIAP